MSLVSAQFFNQNLLLSQLYFQTRYLPLRWRTLGRTWTLATTFLLGRPDVWLHCLVSSKTPHKYQLGYCWRDIYLRFLCTRSSCVPSPYPVSLSLSLDCFAQSRTTSCAHCIQLRSRRTCCVKFSVVWFQEPTFAFCLSLQCRFLRSAHSTLTMTETLHYLTFLSFLRHPQSGPRLTSNPEHLSFSPDPSKSHRHRQPSPSE